MDCHDFASAKSRNDTHPLAPSAREGGKEANSLQGRIYRLPRGFYKIRSQ
ncbi:hypothetical protein [Helicobacter sp. T3_23-1056]